MVDVENRGQRVVLMHVEIARVDHFLSRPRRGRRATFALCRLASKQGRRQGRRGQGGMGGVQGLRPARVVLGAVELAGVGDFSKYVIMKGYMPGGRRVIIGAKKESATNINTRHMV